MLLALALAVVPAGSASGQTLVAPFTGSYTVDDIGQVPGVPYLLGGLTLKAGTNDRLLIGGEANDGPAAVRVGTCAMCAGHIVGFSGPRRGSRTRLTTTAASPTAWRRAVPRMWPRTSPAEEAGQRDHGQDHPATPLGSSRRSPRSSLSRRATGRRQPQPASDAGGWTTPM